MAALVAIPMAIVAAKVVVLDYSLADVLPRRQYDVVLHGSLDGHGGETRVRTFLPATDARQIVSDESNDSPGLSFATDVVGQNRTAVWHGNEVKDGATFTYRFSVLPNAVRFDIDEALPVPDAYPSSVVGALAAEKDVQVDAPEIEARAREIGALDGPVLHRLRVIHDATKSLAQRPFKGTTDALTALRLGEASCNGKSRLFVALARRAGIPARLVGGFVMDVGSKKTTHQWVEAYVGGHWVPFDPTNDHFASLPERYLTLYVGDEVLFRHTADINFGYRFEVSTELVPSPKAKESFRYLNVWALFDRLGLSFLLLRTILLLPVGALVVVLFRNVIGMPTYGTFLPALIAAASGEAGLFWGVVGVMIVVLMAGATRWAFHRLRLLHSPSLAILLAAVALTLLGTALAAEAAGIRKLAYVSLFPIAVLAITAERFFLSLTEKGARTACKELFGTLFVMGACYVVMNSLALQILLIGFPEVLLVFVAVDVYLGRWVGLRVSEYLRFKRILFPGGPA